MAIVVKNNRSAEVQEILNTRPNRRILWGNVMAFVLLFTFFFTLSQYKVPYQIKLPFLIRTGYSQKIGVQEFEIKLLKRNAWNVNNNALATIYLQDAAKKQSLKFVAQIMFSKKTGNDVVFTLLPVSHVPLLDISSVQSGSPGIVEFNVGDISLLKLFASKMTNSFTLNK